MIHTRLKEWHPDSYRCSVSPITNAIGALMGGGAGASTATPTAPAAPPTQLAQPVQQPEGQTPTPKPQAPTFLGAAATPPPTQFGTKTLLGA
jgi:hypothetical protein